MKYAHITAKPNTLYYGDCLEVMEQFPSNWVNLICLDPPFNSDEKYNSIFKGSGLRDITPQVKAFDDTWTWNPESTKRVEHVKNASANPASKVIAAFETFIPRSKMLSYTSYMAERLFQMHRILKPTGSIYLHCDPYASHYLKLIMDAIFGEKNFRNEIVWSYNNRLSHNSKNFSQLHQTIFLYGKTNDAVTTSIYDENWKPSATQKRRLEKGYETRKGDLIIYNDNKFAESGIDENQYANVYYSRADQPPVGDVWNVPILNPMAKERMGYRTQKPVALYERMIKASSNEGDIVLDPFCGCGTTIDAALKNRRRAIGIDILPFALRLINERRLGVPLPVEGIPVSFETAQLLAEIDKKGVKFQDWAISLVDGLASNPEKTGDEGIDGFGMFAHTPDNMDTKGIIVQVTAASGSQNVKFDKLQNDVRKHNAAMGILITKDEQKAQNNWDINLPSVQMGNTTYAPMQCLSIAEYYRNGEHYTPPLDLPALTNPWNGKPMQQIYLTQPNVHTLL